MFKNHTYIKGVSISRKKFDELNESICLRYLRLKEKDKISFSMFQRGILFAYILGNLTAHLDKEATRLFFSCLESSYMPKVKIFRDANNIKIYVCVNMRQLHETREKYSQE